MPISTSVEKAQSSLRATAPDAQRVYTNPRRQSVSNGGDLERLSRALGDVTTSAFRAIGSMNKDNYKKGAELAQLNPEANVTEVLRKSGVPSVFSNQVMNGVLDQRGEMAAKNLVEPSKVHMEKFAKTHLDATPEDFAAEYMRFNDENTFDLEPQSQAIAMNDAQSAIPSFVNLSMVAAAKERRLINVNTVAETIDTDYLNGSDISASMSALKNKNVNEDQIFDATEWDSIAADGMTAIINGPDYSPLRSAKVNTAIRDQFSHDIVTRNKLLTESRKSSDAYENRITPIVTEQQQNYLDDMMWKFRETGELANREEILTMLDHGTYKTYDKFADSVLEYAPEIGMDKQRYDGVMGRLESGVLTWKQASEEGILAAMSFDQRQKAKTNKAIPGWANRNQANKQVEEEAKAGLYMAKSVLFSNVNVPGGKVATAGGKERWNIPIEKGMEGFDGNILGAITFADGGYQTYNTAHMSQFRAALDKTMKLSEEYQHENPTWSPAQAAKKAALEVADEINTAFGSTTADTNPKAVEEAGQGTLPPKGSPLTKAQADWQMYINGPSPRIKQLILDTLGEENQWRMS